MSHTSQGEDQEETQQPRRARAKERALKKLSSRFPGTRCVHFRWCVCVSVSRASPWKPWAAACGPGALCARLSPCSDAAHGSTLDQSERTLLQAQRAGWEARGLGRGRGPAVPVYLPSSGFLCAKQPSVRLTSAALLEICPQLSSPPGESQFLTEVSGPSVAGPCRPTVQVPVQLGR